MAMFQISAGSISDCLSKQLNSSNQSWFLKKIGKTEADQVSGALKEQGIEKIPEHLLSVRAMIAVDKETNKIISYCEVTGVNQMELVHFCQMSRKRKTRIQVGFRSVIFSKNTWR